MLNLCHKTLMDSDFLQKALNTSLMTTKISANDSDSAAHFSDRDCFERKVGSKFLEVISNSHNEHDFPFVCGKSFIE